MGFEPATPATERPQFQTLDGAATVINSSNDDNVKQICLHFFASSLNVQIYSLDMIVEISGKRKQLSYTIRVKKWYIN